MDMIASLILGAIWLMPLGVFGLSSRCPAERRVFWRSLLLLTSWAGLAAYVLLYYWLPELRRGPPSSWRAAT